MNAQKHKFMVILFSLEKLFPSAIFTLDWKCNIFGNVNYFIFSFNFRNIHSITSIKFHFSKPSMDCQQLEISFTKNNANLFKLIDKTHHQCIKWVFILPNLEYNNVIAHNQYDFTFKHPQKDTNKISFVYSAYNQSNALANCFQFLCQLHALSLARWNHRFKCYFVRHFLSIACSSCVRFDFSLIFFVCVFIFYTTGSKLIRFCLTKHIEWLTDKTSHTINELVS